MMSHHAHRTSRIRTDVLHLNNHAKTQRREGIFAQNVDAIIIHILITKLFICLCSLPKQEVLYVVFCSEYGHGMIILVWHVLPVKHQSCVDMFWFNTACCFML
jgi:hypothetical protein